jgi:DNA-binding LytR/AlgR family response regulator
MAVGSWARHKEDSFVRIPVKLSPRRFVLHDAADVYYLESRGHDVLVRTARKTRLRSVQRLGQLEQTLQPHGFLRIHKSYVVNLDRVREVRMREGDDNDWELKLEPPVNVVLPIARSYVAKLRRALGL